MITDSQFSNNLWITYHHKAKVNNKMNNLMSIMLDFPEFCMNNRKNCKSVCKKCYAFIQVSIRGKSLWPKLKHNSQVLSNCQITFDKIESPLNILRFSSYGELNNTTQYLNIQLIAKSNPHLYCAIWSKQINIINKLNHLKPSNLITVWSAGKLNSRNFTIPKSFNKSFYVYTTQDELNKAKDIARSQGFKTIDCNKSCESCLHCYKDHSSTIIMELLK